MDFRILKYHDFRNKGVIFAGNFKQPFGWNPEELNQILPIPTLNLNLYLIYTCIFSGRYLPLMIPPAPVAWIRPGR